MGLCAGVPSWSFSGVKLNIFDILYLQDRFKKSHFYISAVAFRVEGYKLISVIRLYDAKLGFYLVDREL